MTGRVLVVDDVATNRLLFATKLRTAYYDVDLAETGEEALERAAAHPPDLILLDVMMPGIDGIETCRRLKQNPELAHVPVVMITSHEEPEERLRGLTAGADDFLTKPVHDPALFARVRNLIRMKTMVDELRLRDDTISALGLGEQMPYLTEEATTGDVMIVTDAPERGAEIANNLDGLLRGGARIETDLHHALEAAESDPPDAVLIDRQGANVSEAIRLVSALRARAPTRQAAILLVVDEDAQEDGVNSLDLGANDYILRPVDLGELHVRMRSQLMRKNYSDRLRESVREGLMMAVIDPLTGLYNRRYATSHLEKTMRQAETAEEDLAVMILDLDRFKAVNDTHGHDAGDAVLREFAARLRANVRGIDLVARFGGEEFFVTMPGAEQEAAGVVAERIRAAVDDANFILPDGARINVTVSIGVGLRQQGCADPDTLIKSADLALYTSKESGRNRVTFKAAA